jgi:hypothetical protein
MAPESWTHYACGVGEGQSLVGRWSASSRNSGICCWRHLPTWPGEARYGQLRSSERKLVLFKQVQISIPVVARWHLIDVLWTPCDPHTGMFSYSV